jgi:hypothetical protein
MGQWLGKAVGRSGLVHTCWCSFMLCNSVSPGIGYVGVHCQVCYVCMRRRLVPSTKRTESPEERVAPPEGACLLVRSCWERVHTGGGKMTIGIYIALGIDGLNVYITVTNHSSRSRSGSDPGTGCTGP